ncbi:LysR family transcriptional regulator [Paraglaciecola sp. Hal342]
MDTLDGMRTFIAVAKQKSFTGGAKQLGISTKLASKYIAQLEQKARCFVVPPYYAQRYVDRNWAGVFCAMRSFARTI